MKRFLWLVPLIIWSVAYVLLAAKVPMPFWLWLGLSAVFYGGVGYFLHRVLQVSRQDPKARHDDRDLGAG